MQDKHQLFLRTIAKYALEICTFIFVLGTINVYWHLHSKYKMYWQMKLTSMTSSTKVYEFAYELRSIFIENNYLGNNDYIRPIYVIELKTKNAEFI